MFKQVLIQPECETLFTLGRGLRKCQVLCAAKPFDVVLVARENCQQDIDGRSPLIEILNKDVGNMRVQDRYCVLQISDRCSCDCRSHTLEFGTVAGWNVG